MTAGSRWLIAYSSSGERADGWEKSMMTSHGSVHRSAPCIDRIVTGRRVRVDARCDAAIAALCDRLGNHLTHLASRSAQKDGYHKKLPFFCCRIGKNFLFILRLDQLVAAQQLFQMLTRLRLHLIQRQAAAAAAVSHQVHCLFDRNRIDVREQRVDQPSSSSCS